MKILVTGASGFTASHLVPLLEKNDGAELLFTDLRAKNTENWSPCDLTNPSQVSTLLEKTRPDQIYHLAGSFSNHYETDYKVNVLSTKNIFDGCLAQSLRCRILLVGSAAEYGIVKEEDNPVREDQPLNPVSAYGLSKAYQTLLMGYYRKLHDVDVVMARTFNLLGRGMSNRLFVGRLYEQIDQYKKSAIPQIEIGNLQNKRDYMQVDEAVESYQIIMDRGVSGEVYNVGSGKSVKINDILDEIITENGIDRSVVGFRENRSASKLDIKDIFSDRTKLNKLLINKNNSSD